MSSLKEYQLAASDVKFTYNGSAATQASFSPDDMVTLTLTDGLVTAVAGESKFRT